MVIDANTLIKLPDEIDSMSYTATFGKEEFPTEPNFLERATFLHEKGFFKELTIQELRERLRDLYRKSEQLADNGEDVWK